MSTLYLHIPFCKQACHYCDFHFSTVMKTYEPVMGAMRKEIGLMKDFLTDKKLSSVYFGGGTPSLLKEKDLFMLMEEIHRCFDVVPGAEITLEANPDDLSFQALKIFQMAGINRLSIGTQSFEDAELKLMNRVHSASEAEDSIKRAQDAGFENITIDLIYGMPGSTLAGWNKNLQKAISLKVPHLSAYALTVEEKTALAHKVASGEIKLCHDQQIAQQYHALCQKTREAGFEHYELSNFGKPGFRSAHNTAYWQGIPYLGIGPGAHSFNGEKRSWNIANNTLYVKNMEGGTPWWEEEEIGENDRFNEYVMTGLRTAEGISLDQIEKRFGTYHVDRLLQDARNYLECGRLAQHDDQIKIPESEWLISDRIISDLFRI